MDKATDKATLYAETFYGGDIPISQAIPIKQSIMQLVMVLQNDIRNKVRNITPQSLEKAVLAGLHAMHEHGARHPNIHRTDNGIYLKGFQIALAKTRELKSMAQANAEKRKQEQKIAQRMAPHDQKAAALYDLYSRYKEHYVKEGVDTPKIAAYRALLQAMQAKGLDLEGYAYYVVTMKIPTEEGILYDDAVVKIFNDHPRIHNMEFGGPRMEVNGEKVTGNHLLH